jgi:perosamine synthetase
MEKGGSGSMKRALQAHEQLEKDFGDWIGNPNTVACSSGTAALHLALEALQLPLGSRVLVPDFNMVAVPRAVTMAGHATVFVDCKSDLLIDCKLLSRLHNCRFTWWGEVDVVIPVHIYGRRCRMSSMHTMAINNGWKVIEDLAEAHGVQPHPASDAACWSFYKNKIVAGQEGGIVAFRKPEHARLAKQLRCLGFTDAHDFNHIPRGCNYRMSDIHAELILESLVDVQANIAKRRAIEEWYNQQIPKQWQMLPRDACWVYDLRLEGYDTARIVRELNTDGVAARLAFKPMHLQPEYAGCDIIAGPGFKTNAEQASKEVIYLPVHPNMQKQDVAYNVAKLQQVLHICGAK